MAKTALRNKAAAKPKFKVRGYTRCQRCGRSQAVYRKFGLCRICLREMAHAGELPGVTKSPGNRSTTFAAGLREPPRERRTAMTMTDPIADMLTRLRNANSAFHEEVSMPHSKLKAHVAEILKQEGYIAGFKVADAPEGQVGRVLTLDLKYGPNRERSIAGVRRVSKPGLRVYAKATGMPRVLGGLGTAIISTSIRAADRPAGRQARSRRGSPRLRLVRNRS